MIPFTSCMCPSSKSSGRRTCWLVPSQKGSEIDVEESNDVSFCFYPKGSHSSKGNVACHYQPWHISKRISRRPVITPVNDLNLLDHTYSGIAQVLLSKCNHWSFNTFNLDVSTGGRSLPFLLVHLFHEYGFINYFRLDAVKVWRCFNLMEAAYHRHNPYHNSVHAADVTQAMHCFLQENKFANNLTPLEAMSSIIAAVGHDLDHPGVTQTFLVATSNHLVNLYNNSSVLENHHWRTAVSCLLESEMFSHLEKDIWFDIQRQIRSLILATDITRQKEFLSRFKAYLNAQTLDMEQSHYRHFALQIALKCADLCNPCRPWGISQRWSYQVCQEFYRQGSFERQLNLPLTPTFDCSRSRVPKIQTDFFQHVVIPLFDTWDSFLKTRLSNLLLRNLRHNYRQWERKMQLLEKQQRPENINHDDYLPIIRADFDEKVELRDVKLSEKTSARRELSHPLPSEIHLAAYSAEELHPLSTLLSLTSTKSMISLRKACIINEVENHLMCPLFVFPVSSSTSSLLSTSSSSNQTNKSSSCNGNNLPGNNSKSESNCELQSPSTYEKSDFSPADNKECESSGNAEKDHCHSESAPSTHVETKTQELAIVEFHNLAEEDVQQQNTQSNPNPHQQNNETKNKLTNSNSGFHNTCFQSSVPIKNTTTKASLCSTKNVQRFITPVKLTASWCWHIKRSLSAERSQQTCHNYSHLLSAHKGSTTCKMCNKNTGRRGSAPAPMVWSKDHEKLNGSRKSSLGNAEDNLLLRSENEMCGSTVRRWSIPLEPISG